MRDLFVTEPKYFGSVWNIFVKNSVWFWLYNLAAECLYGNSFWPDNAQSNYKSHYYINFNVLYLIIFSYKLLVVKLHY